MSSSRTIILLPVFVLFLLLPFFEGGETSNGLFYFHTIVLLSLAVAAFFYSELCVPRFVIYFVPFLLVLVISTILSDYKYAAFLKLWDYWMAGMWAILVFTLIHQDRRIWESRHVWLFFACAISAVAAILIYDHARFSRISGSFVNPNEYAIFALILFCFGIFCLEHESNKTRKIYIAFLIVLLLLTAGLSRSRSVFLASLFIAFLAFVRHKGSRTIKLLLVLLVLVSGLLITIRLKYYDDPLQYYRLEIWKSSLKGIREDPYLGIGLGMLPYRALTFNFPGESQLGRYGRIARSADSQYVQILGETGFLGLLSFLFGWIGLLFALQKARPRFFYLKLAWWILALTSLFSNPLQNTSVLFLFLFLVAITLSDTEQQVSVLRFRRIGRILIPVGCFLLFAIGCFLPFQAHREFESAIRSKTLQEANQHLNNAIRYNPYQPYYRFAFIRRIVDAGPNFTAPQWLNVMSAIEEAIRLNPLEYEFYLYKARISRRLLQKQSTLTHYSTAVSSYQTALDHNPYNVFLRLEFASFLHQIDRNNLAEQEIRRALQDEPVFLNGRLLLTDVLLSQKNEAQAREEYLMFLDYHSRFGKLKTPEQPPYIQSLLDVNQKQKKKVEELLNVK